VSRRDRAFTLTHLPCTPRRCAPIVYVVAFLFSLNMRITLRKQGVTQVSALRDCSGLGCEMVAWSARRWLRAERRRRTEVGVGVRVRVRKVRRLASLSVLLG
jgi:hypothetical protein